MPTIPQLIAAVQSDLNAVTAASMQLASTSAALFAAESNYQTALTNLATAENSGNQQMIEMAAQALAAANSAALAAEAAFQMAVTTFDAADAQLQTDRAALNAALNGGGHTQRKKVT